jgi:hypothetical protein
MTTNYTSTQIANFTASTSLALTYTLLPVEKKSRKGIFNKAGKFVGKTVSFFRKSETKMAALVSYWAVETVLFAAIMLTAPSAFIFFSALFLYLYGTYAIFSAINALTK